MARLLHKLKYILIILLIWLIIGLLYSAQSYYYRIQIGQDVEWIFTLLVDTPYFILWAFFTPIPLFVSRKFPPVKSRLLSLIFIHASLALSVAFIHALLYNTFRLFVTMKFEGTLVEADFGSYFDRVYLNTVANFDYGTLVYFVVLFVIYAIDYYNRLQEEHTHTANLRTALVQSQLNTLKIQLQPHFLFNTLNSIAVLIKENPQHAEETINQLSDLLRYSLINADKQFVPLENELEFTKRYLAIEQTRFGERLEISMKVDSSLDKILVPSFILQPIVENAVRHGIANKRGKGLINISIIIRDAKINIRVSDDGKGIETESADVRQRSWVKNNNGSSQGPVR